MTAGSEPRLFPASIKRSLGMRLASLITICSMSTDVTLNINRLTKYSPKLNYACSLLTQER